MFECGADTGAAVWFQRGAPNPDWGVKEAAQTMTGHVCCIWSEDWISQAVEGAGWGGGNISGRGRSFHVLQGTVKMIHFVESSLTHCASLGRIDQAWRENMTWAQGLWWVYKRVLSPWRWFWVSGPRWITSQCVKGPAHDLSHYQQCLKSFKHIWGGQIIHLFLLSGARFASINFIY